MGFATKAVHVGNDPYESKFQGVAPVIDLSSTFAQISPSKPPCFDYQRVGHSTRLALERNLASLENAKFALALNCGLATTVSIMQMFEKDSHVICIDDVYGGTQRYLRRICQDRQGFEVSFVDL
mmetsp:Transcript_39493/g.29170  ORF Transcript_39493/g.29170 Transcript_39493/m.29170 type:complete len:124 (-) Transcript_39493:814-1185(-)